MSEKRFIWKCDDETCHIFDTVTKARYFYEGIMNLLNEQQAIIQSLKEENKELKREHHILYAFLIDNGLEEKYLKWRKRNIREPYKIPSITYEIKEYQSRLNIDGKVIDDE